MAPAPASSAKPDDAGQPPILLGPQTEEHLSTLSSSLNQILIQTAKVLRNPQYHDPRYTDLARNRVNEYVRPASETFNNALTDIESQILQAKAVMERDLSRIRKKRMERDRQAGRLPPSPEQKEAAAIDASPTAPVQDIPALNGKKEEDTIMADVDLLSSNEAAQNIDMDNLSKVLGQEDTGGLFDNLPADVAALDSRNTSIANKNNNAESTDQPSNENQPAAAPGVESSLATLGPTDVANTATAATDDFDFDTMFDNLDSMPQDTSMDLGLDLTSTDVGGGISNVISDNAIAGLDLSGLGNAPTNNTTTNNGSGAIPTNEDIDSLLPGLENFVDAPNANPAGAAVAGTGSAANATAAPATGDGAATQAPDSNAAGTVDQTNTTTDELNFDDLFGPGADLDMTATAAGADGNGTNNNNANGGDLLGDSFGEVQDFDDSWWN